MSKYKILHLDSDENVLLEVRKHWIVFVADIFVFIFITILPLLLIIIVDNNFPSIITLLGYKVIFFSYIIWILSFWLYLFFNWTNYFLDVWYVTDKRIIDVEQKAVFHREVSNLRFDKIQDVTVEIKGLIAEFLRYGNIKVQTASENSQDFFMSYVKDPEEVKRIIFTQHNIVGDQDKTKPLGPNIEV